MKRSVLAVVAAALAVVPAAAADVPVHRIGRGCPVPESTQRYDQHDMEYRIRLDLSGCSWYDGRPVVLRGSLTRTTALERNEDVLTVRCEPGAPPFVEPRRSHGGSGPGVGLLAPREAPPPGPREAVRPVDDCLLDLHLQHPPLERAHYTGELRYPGPEGEVVERISLDCIALFDLGGGCQ